MTASSAESAANPPDSPARAARRVAFWSRLNAGDGSVVGMGEHRPSKRHFSFAESHLQMSDNRSYVNYIYLHGRTIPSSQESVRNCSVQVLVRILSRQACPEAWVPAARPILPVLVRHRWGLIWLTSSTMLGRKWWILWLSRRLFMRNGRLLCDR